MNEDTLFVVMIYVMGIVPPIVIAISRVYYFITEERKSERESIDHRIDVRVKRIPAAIQEEIDQTPEWWDREFRRLSGEKVDPYREANEYLAKRGKVMETCNGITFIRPVNGDALIGKALNSERWGRIVEQRLIDLEAMKVGSARDYPVRTYSPGGWIDPAPPTPAELVTEDVIYATLEPDKKIRAKSPNWRYKI